MALFDIKYFSAVLHGTVNLKIIMPTTDEPYYAENPAWFKEGRGYQVLYLLHGIFGDSSSWSRNTAIERYAQANKLMVVCPEAGNTFFVDTVHCGSYLTYLTRELPAFVNHTFPVSGRREDTFIAGLSMGGYGAFRLALERPDLYSAAASLSGALDVYAVCDREDPPADTFDAEAVFGPRDQWSKHDLFALAERKLMAGEDLPALYQCCGTEDFIYDMNLHAKARFERLPLDYTYEEGPGVHDWNYWDRMIQRVLTWLPLAKDMISLQ